MYKGRIKEISAVVPKHIIQNIDVPGFTEKEKLMMIKTTGIKERRLNLCTTTYMAIEACKPLDLTGVSILIMATQTPDHLIPGSSHAIQDYFKLECGCIDMNVACNGFIQGLAVAYSFAAQGGKVLMVFSETMTSILDSQDKNSLLFGDAASAMIIDREGYAEINLHSNGDRFGAILHDQGGFMRMKGEDVFDFTMKEVYETIFEDKCAGIDYFVFHQSNLFILKRLAARLGIPPEKMVINIDRFGNTSACSIPLALVTEKPTGYLMACGYGAGLNWGTAKFDYHPEKIYYNEI